MKRALIVAVCAAVFTLLVPMILNFDIKKADTVQKEETAVSEEETAEENTQKTKEEETSEAEDAADDQSELITIFEG